MKSTYFTSRPGKNPPSQNGCRLKSVLFFEKHRFHILYFPNSTGSFTKPTGRHDTTYRWFSPDMATHGGWWLPIYKPATPLAGVAWCHVPVYMAD
jgi:hypothetical protein